MQFPPPSFFKGAPCGAQMGWVLATAFLRGGLVAAGRFCDPVCPSEAPSPKLGSNHTSSTWDRILHGGGGHGIIIDLSCILPNRRCRVLGFVALSSKHIAMPRVPECTSPGEMSFIWDFDGDLESRCSPKHERLQLRTACTHPAVRVGAANLSVAWPRLHRCKDEHNRH